MSKEYPLTGQPKLSGEWSPDHIKQPHAKAVLSSRQMSETLPNEMLREKIARMSAEEKEVFVRRQRELAKFFNGPGGP